MPKKVYHRVSLKFFNSTNKRNQKIIFKLEDRYDHKQVKAFSAGSFGYVW
jgi:hypothetical protein